MQRSRTFSIFLLVFASLTVGSLRAQVVTDTVPTSIDPELEGIVTSKVPKEYFIGGIIVTGTKRYDQQLLVSIAGINVGDKVMIPGAITLARPSLTCGTSTFFRTYTQVTAPAASMASIAAMTRGTAHKGCVLKRLHRVGLQPVDEVRRQGAVRFALDDLHAGFHRAAHQPAHRFLDAPVQSLALEGASKAGVGDRLAVDQHAIAIKDYEHAPSVSRPGSISKACRLPP